MRMLNNAECQRIRSLMAQAQIQALLEAVRQANLPGAAGWTERLMAVQSAYESQQTDFDTWLREHLWAFGDILQQINGSPEKPVPSLALPDDIEALVLQRRIEEALQRCPEAIDEVLLWRAQYALGYREFQGGRLDTAPWEILQQHLGYAVMAFCVETRTLSKKNGCLRALLHHRRPNITRM